VINEYSSQLCQKQKFHEAFNNTTMSPKGPYKLVTVNTAPERAKRLIGRVVEALKDQYTIQHMANCESEYQI
jgi:hypothetical protein